MSDNTNKRFAIQLFKHTFIKFADHCAQLEENIMKTQERARANAPEFEEAWGNDDYDLSRSRASSPGDDYIDVEGHGGLGLITPNSIHRSMGADTNLSHGTAPIRRPPMPAGSEVKRGRGRPRKQRDPVEEGMSSQCSVLYHNKLIRYHIELIRSKGLVRNWTLHCTHASIHIYIHTHTHTPWSCLLLVMLMLLLYAPCIIYTYIYIDIYIYLCAYTYAHMILRLWSRVFVQIKNFY